MWTKILQKKKYIYKILVFHTMYQWWPVHLCPTIIGLAPLDPQIAQMARIWVDRLTCLTESESFNQNGAHQEHAGICADLNRAGALSVRTEQPRLIKAGDALTVWQRVDRCRFVWAGDDRILSFRDTITACCTLHSIKKGSSVPQQCSQASTCVCNKTILLAWEEVGFTPTHTHTCG